MNRQEYEALEGLPHIARLLYAFSLRMRMDYNTGIVGENYRITWRKISEDLEVIGAPGVKAVRFTRRMLERAAAHLVKVGLIAFQTVSGTRQLIIKCLKATSDQSAQNKVVHKWCNKNEPPQPSLNRETPTHSENSQNQTGTTENSESGAISDYPLISECVSNSEPGLHKLHTYFHFFVKNKAFTKQELKEHIEDYVDYCAEHNAQPSISGCRQLLRSRVGFKANKERVRRAANDLATHRAHKLEALARKEEDAEDRIHSETIYRRLNPVPDYYSSSRSNSYTSDKHSEKSTENIRKEAAEYQQAEGGDSFKVAV